MPDPAGLDAIQVVHRHCTVCEWEAQLVEKSGGLTPDGEGWFIVNVAEAMSKCQSGDTASAIPVLEKALTDQKIALPPRS